MVEVSLEKLKEIYYVLESAYDVVQGEIGQDKQTEGLLEWLRELLSTDEKFMEENSLLVQARKGIGPENILKVFKNKQEIGVAELAKVFFAVHESGFCSGNFSTDVWKKGEDVYVVFKGRSKKKAIETLQGLIRRNKKLIEDLGPEYEIEFEQKEIERFERFIEILER